MKGASDFELDARRNDDADARQTVESALSLALVLGLACCALLELNAGGAVRLMAGGGSGALQGPTDIAEQYLRCMPALSLPVWTPRGHWCHVRQCIGGRAESSSSMHAPG